MEHNAVATLCQLEKLPILIWLMVACLAAARAIRAKNPLQLINRFAPMNYGSGEDNVHRDAVSDQGAYLISNEIRPRSGAGN